MTTTTTKVSPAEIFAVAQAAAESAAKECIPTPMIVGTPTTVFGNDIDYTKQTYFVAGGVCGFAGVVIKPARGALITYLKSQGIGYSNYGGGWYVPSWQFAPSTRRSQSYEIACAAAGAAGKVLSELGYRCYLDSRLD